MKTVSAPTTDSVAARGAVSDHVLVISIDGLRPDAIEKYGAAVIKRLSWEGAAAEGARTVAPGNTLATHMSMLTGVAPEGHGMGAKEDSTKPRPRVPAAVPTVFELAKNAGFTTALFFSNPKLKQLLKAGTLNYASGPVGWLPVKAQTTVEAAAAHIRTNRPNLVFVQLSEPDYVGHVSGWMSRWYGRAVVRADSAVGELLVAADETYGAGHYSVIVTADHGGERRGHSSDSVTTVMQIPWIAWGAGVQQSTIYAPVRTMDTAATVLWLLGVDRPAEWSGRAVASAYTTSAQRAATHGSGRPVHARAAGRRRSAPQQRS